MTDHHRPHITGPGLDAHFDPSPPKHPVTRDPDAQSDPPTHRLLTHPDTLDPRVAADDAATPLPDSDAEDIAGARLARRLFVAAVLIAITAVVCWVVLPRYGMVLPPIVPPLVFVAIFLGAVLSHAEEHADHDEDDDTPGAPRHASDLARSSSSLGQACQTPDDEGRPITCGGPRPPRFLSKRPKR